MKCPLDGETLLVSERQGVEIDYCPKCRGIWLDRGELDKIIDQAAGMMLLPDPQPMAVAPEQEAPPQLRERRMPQEQNDKEDRRRRDDREYKRGKRNKKRKNRFGDFLEDFFDFD